MTTTIVIGENKPSKTLKAIKFERVLDLVGREAEVCPHTYKFIELICKDYAMGHDLMFAYNDPSNRKQGVLYIGKWNDGVVE